VAREEVATAPERQVRVEVAEGALDTAVVEKMVVVAWARGSLLA